jgi:hypothetical protein
MTPNTGMNGRVHRKGECAKAGGGGSAHQSRVCRELSRQVEAIKRGMVREFGTAISGQTQLLNAALIEAEALAWQTPYPHLLFPVLAQEKASAVTRWAARQRSVTRASRQIALTA